MLQDSLRDNSAAFGQLALRGVFSGISQYLLKPLVSGILSVSLLLGTGCEFLLLVGGNGTVHLK